MRRRGAQSMTARVLMKSSNTCRGWLHVVRGLGVLSSISFDVKVRGSEEEDICSFSASSVPIHENNTGHTLSQQQ